MQEAVLEPACALVCVEPTAESNGDPILTMTEAKRRASPRSRSSHGSVEPRLCAQCEGLHETVVSIDQAAVRVARRLGCDPLDQTPQKADMLPSACRLRGITRRRPVVGQEHRPAAALMLSRIPPVVQPMSAAGWGRTAVIYHQTEHVVRRWRRQDRLLALEIPTFTDGTGGHPRSSSSCGAAALRGKQSVGGVATRSTQGEGKRPSACARCCAVASSSRRLTSVAGPAVTGPTAPGQVSPTPRPDTSARTRPRWTTCGPTPSTRSRWWRSSCWR